MYNDWKIDSRDSTRALLKIENTFLPKLISGRIHSVESSNQDILILMDQKSGIDLIREDKIGLQGIASRIQFIENYKKYKEYETFTIRKERFTGSKTEYEKRIEQIENGYFYPEFTMQLYFNNRSDLKYLFGAIIKTKNLYDFIKNNPDKLIIKKSDNYFYIVKFEYLSDYGIKIKRNYDNNQSKFYSINDVGTYSFFN